MDFVHFTLYLLRTSTQRKHIFRWLNSFQKDFFLRRRQPWMVFDAVDFLNSLPIEGKRVFEYGSGGSTLYWLSRNMICVSVEHDLGWYETVRIHLDASMKADYRLVQPKKSQSEESLDIANPLLYLSGDPAFRGYCFKNYASQIDAFPDGNFDVVLVDGRARPACIMHSAPKVKVNGLLILDNADRIYYTPKTGSFLRNYSCLPFYGIGAVGYQMWGTNIYMRQQ
jgi:hypothetical protein